MGKLNLWVFLFLTLAVIEGNAILPYRSTDKPIVGPSQAKIPKEMDHSIENPRHINKKTDQQDKSLQKCQLKLEISKLKEKMIENSLKKLKNLSVKLSSKIAALLKNEKKMWSYIKQLEGKVTVGKKMMKEHLLKDQDREKLIKDLEKVNTDMKAKLQKIADKDRIKHPDD